MPDLSLLPDQLLNGLVLGSLYVLIALGLSVIFGMVGLVNLAHGVLFALGAYFALTLQGPLGYAACLPIVPVLVAIVAVVLEVTLFRRIYEKDPMAGLLLTFALALVIEAGIRMIWGVMGYPFPIPRAFSGILTVGGVTLSRYRLFVMAVTALLVLALWAGLGRTRIGRIIRAGSTDPEMVLALGVNLKRVFTAVVAIGAGLAGTAGMLAAPLWGVHPAMGANALLPSFVVVVMGGLGSFGGAIVGGVLVGEIVALSAWLWPPAADVMIYVLMGLVLLFRPRGLFGRPWERFE